MLENKPLRELNTPTVGWVPISLDFGRDEALCAIDDEDLILSAAGLMVASIALCLSKDDDWLSEKEVFRVAIPGSKAVKILAAQALCSVGLWAIESQGGEPGWKIGVQTALADKRKRIESATRAANARYAKAKEKSAVQVAEFDEESPF